MRAGPPALLTAADVVPAGILTAAAVALSLTADGDPAGTWVDTLVAPALTAPLLWRRRAPLATTVAVAAGMVLSGIPTFDQPRCAVAIPTALLALVTLAARRGLPASLLGLAALLGGLVALERTDPIIRGDAAGFLVVAGGLLAVAVAGGRAIGVRRRLVTALEDRARELHRRRETAASLAVELDRARVGGDLDGAVRARLEAIAALAAAEPGDPEATRAAFGRIEATARSALNDMRGMLGALRSAERADVRDAVHAGDG